jgi:hypothetical protein
MEVKVKIELPTEFVEMFVRLVEAVERIETALPAAEEEEEEPAPPVAKAKAGKAKPEPEPEAEETEEEGEVTEDSIKELATSIASQSLELKEKVKAAIKKVGKAETLKDLKPENYEKLHAALEKLKPEDL